MTIQELGSLGELIAAIATVVTLAYLAVQLRQNTRAQRSATFQAISSEMSSSSEAIATHPSLAEVIAKAARQGDALTAEEQIRYNFMMLMTFRRLEAVYVQRSLGAIGSGMQEGFDRSAISTLTNQVGAWWWREFRGAFSDDFASHVDRRLAAGGLRDIHFESRSGSPGPT